MKNRDFRHVISLLNELKIIFESENEATMASAISGVCYILAYENISNTEKWLQAKKSYLSLTKTRPFSDFYIEGSTADERKTLNKRLDEITCELWDVFSE